MSPLLKEGADCASQLPLSRNSPNYTRVNVGDFLECWNHLNIWNKNINKLSHFYTMSLFFFSLLTDSWLKNKN